jgi:ASPM-SPD-2-Hydin domain-containing protein
MPKALIFISILFIACAAFAQTPIWPGQSGNAVGYAAAPGWPGSFTATACPSSPSSGSSWSNATVVSNCTYSSATTVSCNYCIFEYVDFQGGTNHSAQISGSHILFWGSRFQSNATQGGNVASTSSYVYWFYDSIVPLTSFYTSPPGSTQWPSAGAGANSTTQTSGTNSVAANEGYEYGINLGSSTGPFWVDHSDFWGFGNAINLNSGSTAAVVVTNNWIHDAAYPTVTGGNYHTDVCPGYLNGATPPSNVTMIGNTCASLGSNQSLPLQTATSNYSNIYVNDNFFSGGGSVVISYCLPSGGASLCVNSTFYGNVLGTDIMPGGITYAAGFTMGSGSVWACNTIEVLSGTTWTVNGWAPSSGENGDYYINSSNNAIPYSTTDQGSNTFCGIPTPSSLNFGMQGSGTTSAGKTVTFYSTNTGNLTSVSASLATGTQFSIFSNTCGSTLNSGSNCAITVKFSPTALGPQTDTLHIANNSSGVSSPQLIPLAGVGITATQSFTCSPSTVPAHHSGNITETCTGSGTSWTNSTSFTISGVTGASLVSSANNSATSQTLVITTGSGTGTLTITDTTDSISTTISVANAMLSVSPPNGTIGTNVNVTFTGTNTVWTQETPSTLFSISGGVGASVSTPTVISNTSAVATITVGSAAGTLIITDNSTTATTNFTANSGTSGPPPANFPSVMLTQGNFKSTGASR